jgi:hypothetical protein
MEIRALTMADIKTSGELSMICNIVIAIIIINIIIDIKIIPEISTFNPVGLSPCTHTYHHH